jgi:hypothetical protein
MKLSAFQSTYYLFLFTIAILVVFGIGSLLRISENTELTLVYVFYALAMFGDAVVMSLCVWQLNKHTKLIYSVSMLVLALNILLTIFDQFGLVDLLFVLLNLITLIALLMARKEFLPA